MRLVDMSITQEEAKEQMTLSEKPGDAPKYPYGLRLCLNEEALSKLGIQTMPIGTKVSVMATATVVSMSAYQEVDGDNRRSLDIQIESLGLESQGGNSFEQLADKLYPTKK
jgi:hypothetical protein